MKRLNFKELIIFEDGDYIIVNKPPYVSTLDDRVDSQNMLSLAKGYCESIQMCHRLDKETSGILVMAKNPEAYRSLSIQFEQREVHKLYKAVVAGNHNFDEEVVDLPIHIQSNRKVKIDRYTGKPSTTIISTHKAYKNYTILDCMPITGRMHQIRVHLASLGASIVCDPMYGGENIYLSSIKKKFNHKREEENPIIRRVALHSHLINFATMNGEQMMFEAPFPKDFSVLLKQLEKYN